MFDLARRLLFLAGVALLLASATQPWFAVPVGEGSDPGTATLAEPRCTPWFQVLMAAGALLLAALAATGRRTALPLVSGLIVAAPLIFPHAVMLRDPAVASTATWLHTQHQNLIWLGGDANTSAEHRLAGWKDRVYVVDTPRQVSVIKLPGGGPHALQLGRLSELVEWLGWSNRFCQFAMRGWYWALLGAALAGLMASSGRGRNELGRTLLVSAVVLLACGALAMVAPLRAAAHLDEAREHAARGRYEEARRRLAAAGDALPVLREDTYFVAQAGLVDLRLGRSATPAARLFHAAALERAGRVAPARDAFRTVMETAAPGSGIHREAVRALLRAGIHALNAGAAARAATLLEEVLQAEPCNLKANYALQLASLRLGDGERLEQLVERMRSVYAAFRMPGKRIMLAMASENLALAHGRAGDAVAAVAHLQRSRRP